MRPSEHPLYAVLEAACPAQDAASETKIVAFTSPFRSSGTSYVARDFAMLAAIHLAPIGGKVALMDCDLDRQSHSQHFQKPRIMKALGDVKGPFDASFGQMPFWKVGRHNFENTYLQRDYCHLYHVGDTGLVFSAFASDAVPDGETIGFVRSPEYWAELKKHFSLIIMDIPADESVDVTSKLTVFADQTILVAHPTRAQEPAYESLSEKIKAAGGNCLGLVFNEGVPIAIPYIAAS